jgi:uroporphyrinogen decarboxylase
MAVDAAILFADIMLVPIAMGIPVRIVDSVGPVIDDPITPTNLARLQPIAGFDYLLTTIKLLRCELTIPLIGFSGAPFTLASYLIEGQPSRDWLRTKRFMYTAPEAWHSLMAKLTDAIIIYLHEQTKAGAQALQLFDSWVGCLSRADFVTYVKPYNDRIIASLADTDVPRIVFGTDTSAILTDFAGDADVVGIDWRLDLSEARRRLPGRALQGNLDPAVLTADWPTIQAQADAILQAGGRTGHIFNLGHGVHKDLQPDTLKRLVDYVHERTS